MDALKKLKRRLTLSDKERTVFLICLYPIRIAHWFTANFDEYNDENDIDDDAHRDFHRDYEKAETEEDKYPQGRPNSMLNRLISHGNKKTEDEMSRGTTVTKENQAPGAGAGATAGTSSTTGTTGTSS
jgi:hypothetical protein